MGGGLYFLVLNFKYPIVTSAGALLVAKLSNINMDFLYPLSVFLRRRLADVTLQGFNWSSISSSNRPIGTPDIKAFDLDSVRKYLPALIGMLVPLSPRLSHSSNFTNWFLLVHWTSKSPNVAVSM